MLLRREGHEFVLSTVQIRQNLRITSIILELKVVSNNAYVIGSKVSREATNWYLICLNTIILLSAGMSNMKMSCGNIEDAYHQRGKIL